MLRTLRFPSLTALAAGALFAGALALPAVSAELGRVTIDGKEIAVFNDGSWRYVADLAPMPAGCTPEQTWQSHRLTLSMCVPTGTWTEQGSHYAFEAVFTDPKSTVFSGIITEAMPLETAQMKDLVLAMVKDNPEIAEIKDVSYRTGTFGANELGILEYTTVLKKGVNLRYMNVHGGLPGKGNFQLLFWTAPELYAENVGNFEKLAQSVTLK
jgi:hypothetical protein